MTPTADQRAFLIRLDVRDMELAVAAQTCGVRAYLEARVRSHGESVIYARMPGGKGVETYGEALDRLWPSEKKRHARK